MKNEISTNESQCLVTAPHQPKKETVINHETSSPHSISTISGEKNKSMSVDDKYSDSSTDDKYSDSSIDDSSIDDSSIDDSSIDDSSIDDSSIDDKSSDWKKSGHLYILYNPMYQFYGKNVYKLGKAINCQKRCHQYTTSYIEPPELKHCSERVPCYGLAERLLFQKLRKYRISSKREFFRCEIEIIVNHMNDVTKFMLSTPMEELEETFRELKKQNIPRVLFLNNKISRLFGLKDISNTFHQEWVDTGNYHKMENLVWYLYKTYRTNSMDEGGIWGDTVPPTEKNIGACQLMDQLLEVCGLDLRGYFFTGMPSIQTEIASLLPHQLTFLKLNRRDLLTYFGPSGRVRGQMETTYHLNKLVSRILSSFFGVEWRCQQTQTKKNGKKKHDAVYSLEIPDEIYELLSYRVLSYRQEKLQWMFPLVICGQLKNKYRQIGKTWTQLAICTEWPECPEIEMVLKKEPKIKLKLKPVSIDSIQENNHYEEADQIRFPAEENEKIKQEKLMREKQAQEEKEENEKMKQETELFETNHGDLLTQIIKYEQPGAIEQNIRDFQKFLIDNCQHFTRPIELRLNPLKERFIKVCLI